MCSNKYFFLIDRKDIRVSDHIFEKIIIFWIHLLMKFQIDDDKKEISCKLKSWFTCLVCEYRDSCYHFPVRLLKIVLKLEFVTEKLVLK